MKKLLILLFVFVGIVYSCNSSSEEYPKADQGITWIDVETANAISNQSNKLFIVDMYTDWCGWCKVMDKKTFTDPEVIAYMDEHFHSIKFNAEQKEAVTFLGKRYNWIKQGRNGINLLAKEWLGNRLSYPSYVFLDANKQPIKVARGYMQPIQFLNELKSVTTQGD